MKITIDAIQQGLAKARQQNTAQTLGDRSTYVGASDVGHCLRKVILSKITPKEPDLASLIRFARGHVAESIIAEALSAAQPNRQVELEAHIPYCGHCRCWTSTSASGPMHCPDCGHPMRLLPLKAHCDFVFDDDLILECKSSQATEIRDSWRTQLQTQMLLYEHCTGQSPQGFILVMDLAQGEVNIVGPYVLDPVLVPDIIQRGIEIWEGVVAALSVGDPENTLDIKTEPGPLCGWCDYLATCPAFCGDQLPDALVGFFEDYLAACKAEKDAKSRKDALRDQALAMLEPGKYMAGNLRVSLSERGRTGTDMNSVADLLAELGQDITAYQNRTSYQVLDVKAAR